MYVCCAWRKYFEKHILYICIFVYTYIRLLLANVYINEIESRQQLNLGENYERFDFAQKPQNMKILISW